MQLNLNVFAVRNSVIDKAGASAQHTLNVLSTLLNWVSSTATDSHWQWDIDIDHWHWSLTGSAMQLNFIVHDKASVTLPDRHYDKSTVASNQCQSIGQLGVDDVFGIANAFRTLSHLINNQNQLHGVSGTLSVTTSVADVETFYINHWMWVPSMDTSTSKRMANVLEEWVQRI